MNKILSPLRRAVDDYAMISEGDRIAVGVSGGKDSVTLLFALDALSKFYPKKFTVTGICLDLGRGDVDYSPLENLAKEKGIELIIKKTDISKIVFDIRKEQNPCSLCSVLRRGALNNTAKELGMNKIALGHNFNDVVETFMMNLLNEGRIGCFSPMTYLDRKDITVIRPLIYATEKEITSCVKRNGFPIIKNPCPADGNTERQNMKEFLANLDENYDNAKQKMFGALQKSGIDGWKETVRGRKD